MQEPRVRAIVDAILIGGEKAPDSFPTDDLSYVIDLGLITRKNKIIEISNPIYREVIPRELTDVTQLSIMEETLWYLDGNKLNMTKLLTAFTQFYRENSAIWLEKFAYKEAGPHLLLMAFLQRIINGGGSINREYALGKKRCDLLICWPVLAPVQRIVIELKVWRNDKSVAEGLQQTAEYMDSVQATEAHLVIFDRTAKTWEEKIFNHTQQIAGKTVNIWGM